MSDFNYERIANTALKQIKRFGQFVTVLTKNQSVYNPATSSYAKTEVVMTGVKAVVANYKQKEIDGTLVQVGDFKILISPVGLTSSISNNDVVTLASGRKCTLKDVRIIAPGGVTVLYICQAR